MLTGGSYDRMTVHVGHLEVGDDGVEPLTGKGIDRGCSTRERCDLVAIHDQEHPQSFDSVELVVYEEKPQHGAAVPATQAGAVDDQGTSRRSWAPEHIGPRMLLASSHASLRSKPVRCAEANGRAMPALG